MSRRAGHFPINGRSYQVQDGDGAAAPYSRPTSARPTPEAAELTSYRWGHGDGDLSDEDVRVLRRATSPVGSRTRDDLFGDDLDDEPHSQPLPTTLDYSVDEPYQYLDHPPPVVAAHISRPSGRRSPPNRIEYDENTYGVGRRSRDAPGNLAQQNAYEAGYEASFPVTVETASYEAPRQRRAQAERARPRATMASASTARHAYIRREGSDQGAGGYFANEFRIVKPFTFVPRGPGRDGPGPGAASPGDVLSDSESPMPDDGGPLGTTDFDDLAGPPDNAANVYRSLYTGDGYYDGSHSAELSVNPVRGAGARPLFRWLHIQQTLQDFDAFSSQITRLAGLSDPQRAAIGDSLRYVHKHFVKSRQTSKGTTIRYMDPGLFQSSGHAQEDIMAKDSSDPRASAVSHTTTSDMAGRSSSVVWVCLPYFFLNRYSGLGAGEGHNGSFPPLTLLQAQYAGHSRERDMMQAVCRLGNVPQGWCYHIGQLWAMVVDEAVLITCGSMTEAALRGDFIKLNPVLIPQPSPSKLLDAYTTVEPGVAKVFVEYGSSFMWALPVEECPTWFVSDLAFIRHFREFWPLSTTFKYRSSPIRPAQWPKILKIARKPKTTMILALEVSQPPRPFAGGVLPKPLSDAKPSLDPSIAVQLTPPVHRNYKGGRGSNSNNADENNKKHEAERVREPFHVFTWRSKCKASEASTDAGIRWMMGEEDDFLRADSGSHDSRAYRNARVETRQNVFQFLCGQEKFRNEIINYDTRVDLFNSADLVFQFFLPLQARLPTCGQFWGSVMTLVQGQESPESIRFVDRNAADSNLSHVANRLEALAGTFHVFRWMMSYASDHDRVELVMPGPLPRAWLHVVMGLVHAAIGQRAVPLDDFWLQHLDIAYQYMMDGMRSILDGLAARPLVTYAAVRPTEVLAMISLGLTEDVVGKYPNVSDTYETYLQSLESNIAAQASPSHQYRINNVKSEISMVRQTRICQLHIFKGLRATYTGFKQDGPSGRADAGTGRQLYKSDAPPPSVAQQRTNGSRSELAEAMPPVPLESFNRISSTTYGGLKGLIFSDGSLFLERKVSDFEEYAGQARMLEQSNTARLDVTRDRQERATYAFTVVTIIFLPLSAVSSIFGMNSSDVRDMDAGQWLYWAVAVPVTVLVILVGLWWMGELGPLLQWGVKAFGTVGGQGRHISGEDGGGVLLTGPLAAMNVVEAEDGLGTKPRKRKTNLSDSVKRPYSKSSKSASARRQSNARDDDKADGVAEGMDASDPLNPLSDDDQRAPTIQEQVRQEVARVLERQRREQMERRVLDALRLRQYQRQQRLAEEEHAGRRFRMVVDDRVDDRVTRNSGGERVPEGVRYYNRPDRTWHQGRGGRERGRDDGGSGDRDRGRDRERERGRERGRDRDSDTELLRESPWERRGTDQSGGMRGGRRRFQPMMQTRIVERSVDGMENGDDAGRDGDGNGGQGQRRPGAAVDEGTQTSDGGRGDGGEGGRGGRGGHGDTGRVQPELELESGVEDEAR